MDGLVLPGGPLGVTPLHMGYEGTITLTPDTYVRLVTETCASTARHGAKHLLILNWHEGNIAPLAIAADAIHREWGMTVLTVQACYVAEEMYGKEFNGLTHGGEIETLAVLEENGVNTIIADPRDLSVVRKINAAIKQRDFWMPFAPSILEEDAGEYFVNARPARYMIEAFDTTAKGADLAAALHPQDRTARPQTVNSWNPGYRRAIETFRDESGVGGVLNTSFNLHGFPIVGPPDAAISTFENSQLDALALGNFLILR